MVRYFTEHQIIPLFSVMFYFSLLVEWMISVYMITAVACVVLIFYFFNVLATNTLLAGMAFYLSWSLPNSWTTGKL
jgi:hypothetical protein